MKKSIIIIFLFILGTSNILIKSKNTKVTYNKNEIISASYVIPEDLEELDENAHIILKGSFTGNRDRKSTRLNSSHVRLSRMPSSA